MVLKYWTNTVSNSMQAVITQKDPFVISNFQCSFSAELPEGVMTSILPLLPMADISGKTLKPENGKIGRNDTAEIHLTLQSFLVDTIRFEHISLGVRHYSVDSPVPVISPTEVLGNHLRGGLLAANSQPGQKSPIRLLPSNPKLQQPLEWEEEVRYQLDSTSSMKMANSSLLACRNTQAVLKREDSTSSLGRLQDVVQKEDTTLTLECENVELTPGENDVMFSFKVGGFT